MAETVDSTLAQRGGRYGDFAEHARITHNVKRAMADSPNWATLPDYMREALEMVAHKVGRILNGDPFYADSWHDIAGYSKLVDNRLTLESDTPQPFPMIAPGLSPATEALIERGDEDAPLAHLKHGEAFHGTSSDVALHSLGEDAE